jgi:tetratricopeptide (TPR) repeat protein
MLDTLFDIGEDAEAFGVNLAEFQAAQTDLTSYNVDMGKLAGFTPEEISALYAKGMDLLRVGLHKRAVSVFLSLLYLKPFEGRYYRALGMAFHYQREFGWARALYGQALVLDPEDRISLALRAECALYTISKQESYEELKSIVEKGARDPVDAPYIDRARAILAKIAI